MGQLPARRQQAAQQLAAWADLQGGDGGRGLAEAGRVKVRDAHPGRARADHDGDHAGRGLPGPDQGGRGGSAAQVHVGDLALEHAAAVLRRCHRPQRQAGEACGAVRQRGQAHQPLHELRAVVRRADPPLRRSQHHAAV
jgi:hypothetical protein